MKIHFSARRGEVIWPPTRRHLIGIGPVLLDEIEQGIEEMSDDVIKLFCALNEVSNIKCSLVIYLLIDILLRNTSIIMEEQFL
jgi:hypothetical protein